jgi:hypothetical protein
MFLPCKPCCGVEVSCFDGCPAKTNTLRLNISAQDYRFSQEVLHNPFGTGAVTKYYDFFFEGSAYSGTVDLVSTDGFNYYYYSGSCASPNNGYLRAALQIGGVCDLSLRSYTPFTFRSTLTSASCSVYDNLAAMWGSQPRGFNVKIQCSTNVGSIDGTTFARTTLPLTALTLQEARDAYDFAPSKTTSMFVGGGGTSTQLLFGVDGLGSTIAPVGGPTVTGSPIVTVNSATFV